MSPSPETGTPGSATHEPRRAALPALRRLMLASLVAGLVIGAASLCAQTLRLLYADPTGAEYVAHAGQDATLLAAGQLRVGGETYTCAHVPTVLSSRLDDYGAAYFGLILLHPDRFAAMSPVLRRFSYAHECGHQFIGRNEFAADCYAVRTGRSEGWLDAAAMDEICTFISQTKGSDRHPPGPARCAHMRQCLDAAPAAALRH
jgi:hypothetical protein